MNLLASVEMVAARVGEPISEDWEISLAEAMLEYASSQALFYGDSTWIAETVPGVVRSIVVEAAARGYQHPAGFESERADSVNFTVNKDWLRSAELTDDQVAIVRRAAQKHGRVRSLSASRANRLVARSERRRGPFRVPYCPEEDVPMTPFGRGDAFAFNRDGEW